MTIAKLPTLDDLLVRLKAEPKFRESCVEVYRRVAAGERHPTDPPLPDNAVIFACQAMTILFNHVDGIT